MSLIYGFDKQCRVHDGVSGGCSRVTSEGARQLACRCAPLHCKQLRACCVTVDGAAPQAQALAIPASKAQQFGQKSHVHVHPPQMHTWHAQELQCYMCLCRYAQELKCITQKLQGHLYLVRVFQKQERHGRLLQDGPLLHEAVPAIVEVVVGILGWQALPLACRTSAKPCKHRNSDMPYASHSIFVTEIKR